MKSWSASDMRIMVIVTTKDVRMSISWNKSFFDVFDVIVDVLFDRRMLTIIADHLSVINYKQVILKFIYSQNFNGIK